MMDITNYLYDKFHKGYPKGTPQWVHLLSLVYGYKLHNTRLAVASHIVIIYSVISIFFDGKIIHYGQLILASMLLLEIYIFTRTENAIEDFKKL